MRRLLHTPAGMLLRRIALLYAVLMLCRAAFWAYNAAQLGALPQTGLRQLLFDTASVVYADGLFVLLSLLPLHLRERRWYRNLLFGYYVAVNSLFVVAANLADAVYFRYTQKRFTADEIFFADNDNSLQLVGKFMAENWYLVLAWLALTALLAAILLHLRPMLENLATARCANTVSRIVVAAVNDAVENGWMEYDRLVKFDKDSDGRVTALSSNMAEFNRLQTAVADDVLARLSQVSASELAVPLGTLTGSPLLAGRGPKLTVKMETIGTATAKFRDKFTAAGINQTKHQILLDVDVRVSILLPGITTYTKVSNEISVAETVIVGGVPQTYTYFSTTEDKIEDYADEYIMNNG